MTLNEWSHCFSDNLLDLLADRRMSQYDLADESGVSVGSISAYINKKSLPGVKAIINIASALDVNIDDLIDFGDIID